MEDVDRIRLIEKKRRNRLGSQKQVYDDLYMQDSSFKAEVEDYNDILDGLDMLHLDELESNCAKWEKKHRRGAAVTKMIPLKRFYTYFAAAAVALLFCVSFLFNGFLGGDELAGHFEVENFSSLAIMGGEVRTGDYQPTEVDQVKSDALRFFTNEDYPAAIDALNDFINNHKTDDLQVLLVLSIAQLEEGDAASASRNLEIVINAPKHSNQATAEWIMALAQYKMGNTDACKKFLQSIVGQKGHEYTQNAEKLLEELK
ncbi:MAG: hypothetical protein GY810_23655 [Aureispira sp.]|nr:hypothetical protein [Aureispira sp.]